VAGESGKLKGARGKGKRWAHGSGLTARAEGEKLRR